MRVSASLSSGNCQKVGPWFRRQFRKVKVIFGLSDVLLTALAFMAGDQLLARRLCPGAFVFVSH